MTRDVRTEDRTSHLFSKRNRRSVSNGDVLGLFEGPGLSFDECGRVLSHSRPATAESQDPLHLVPKDISVGPELSSTTSEDDFGIGSTFLPGFHWSRKRTLGCSVCYYLWISEKTTVSATPFNYQPRASIFPTASSDLHFR